MSTENADNPISLRPAWNILAGIVALLVPILLVLVSVRLVMTETYLRLEYQRPGFPEDLYGWDTETRLDYGPYGIRYLVQNQDISYLGDLEIDDDPAFDEDELEHMEDVQVVTRWALRVLNISLLLFVLLSTGLLWRKETRPVWLRGISWGGFLTLGISAILVVLVVVAWDFFFDTFHALFFEAGTWQFSLSDTLIRLYPQQFWFDSSLLVGVITIGGALLCAFVPRRRLKRLKAQI
jgi:integral membrane protein (TIGR01906 family)